MTSDLGLHYTSQGDITKLAVGAIVNAANRSLLGRFIVPFGHL